MGPLLSATPQALAVNSVQLLHSCPKMGDLLSSLTHMGTRGMKEASHDAGSSEHYARRCSCLQIPSLTWGFRIYCALRGQGGDENKQKRSSASWPPLAGNVRDFLTLGSQLSYQREQLCRSKGSSAFVS